MEESKFLIVVIPNGKSFVVRCSEALLLGDVRIEGSIVGISNTYNEAETIYRNLIK